ncbi:hypothetical protein IG631_20792 [Alternaria alternata]|nr:hypothetical protein IG631_20792 [Alternaria alternata]
MTGEVADGANGYQHPMAWSHLPSPSQRAAVKRTLNSTALASVLEEANIQNQTIPFPRALAAPRATPGKRRSGPGILAQGWSHRIRLITRGCRVSPRDVSSPAPFTQVFRLTCAVAGTGIPKIASHVAHSTLSYLGRQAAVAVLASAFALQTPRSPHFPDPIPPHAKSDAHQAGGANASSSFHRYLTAPDLPDFTFLLQLCYLFL